VDTWLLECAQQLLWDHRAYAEAERYRVKGFASRGQDFHHLFGQFWADPGFLVLKVRVKGFASRG
jgi:hypothetical protein